jgi:hypothetical protein
MQDINLVAVLVVTVGAFILSGVWYGIFGKAIASLQTKQAAEAAMGPQQIALEILRTAIVTIGIAVLLSQLNVASAVEGIGYGLLLWVTFPVVLLAGSVMHEKVHPKLAAIHAGDWLVKLLVISTVLSMWR